MPRHVERIDNEQSRNRALNWLRRAPLGFRVEFSRNIRSLEQNDLMWAKIRDVAAQKTHHGQEYDVEDWKTLFLVAMGKEMRIAPALDGNGFTPLGVRSSKLTVEEMSELIDFIDAWGAQNGVVFGDQQRDAA